MRLDRESAADCAAPVGIGAGARFGRLQIIGEGDPYFWRGRFSRRRWLCICDCGRETAVREDLFRSGRTISCGCARDEVGRERMLRHGARAGHSRTPEYGAWQVMLRRFGRDAVVADWQKKGGEGFANFLRCVGPRPEPSQTLCRLDKRKPLGPGNCTWAVPSPRPGVPRRFLDVDGERMTLRNAALSHGISYALLSKRLQRGWPLRLALGLRIPRG